MGVLSRQSSFLQIGLASPIREGTPVMNMQKISILINSIVTTTSCSRLLHTQVLSRCACSLSQYLRGARNSGSILTSPFACWLAHSHFGSAIQVEKRWSSKRWEKPMITFPAVFLVTYCATSNAIIRSSEHCIQLPPITIHHQSHFGSLHLVAKPRHPHWL